MTPSQAAVRSGVVSSVGRVLGEGVVLGRATAAFPVVRTDLVDINTVTNGHREHLDRMKLIFSMKGRETLVLMPGEYLLLEPVVFFIHFLGDPRRADHPIPERAKDSPVEVQMSPQVLRYFKDLFYLAPYYHEAFPDIDKLLVLDLDLEFRYATVHNINMECPGTFQSSRHPRVDVLELYGQFNNFAETALVGVGPDLGKRYREGAEEYLQMHPASPVGGPGFYQVDKDKRWSQGRSDP